jgi:putative FmdB family regulatory protein
MPFYEYKCSNCGFELEELQRMSEEPLTKCPNCHKDTLQKLIGTGGGLIFKGSGFYLTDYKKKSTSGSQSKETIVKDTTSSKDTSPGKSKKETKQPEKKSSSTENKKSSSTKKEK